MKLPNLKQNWVGLGAFLTMFLVSFGFTHLYLQTTGFSAILAEEEAEIPASKAASSTSKNKRISNFINYNLALLIGTCAGVGVLGSMVTIFIGVAGLFEDEKTPNEVKYFQILIEKTLFESKNIEKQLQNPLGFQCVQYFSEVHLRLRELGLLNPYPPNLVVNIDSDNYFCLTGLDDKISYRNLVWLFTGPITVKYLDDNLTRMIFSKVKEFESDSDFIAKYELIVVYYQILSYFGVLGNVDNIIQIIQYRLQIILGIKNIDMCSGFFVNNFHRDDLITNPIRTQEQFKDLIVYFLSSLIPNDGRKSMFLLHLKRFRKTNESIYSKQIDNAINYLYNMGDV